jgi:AcrR family transcriptional regulator
VTGGRRRSVEVRREEILTATLAEVDRIGLAATRVSDVAGALGVSSALVFYHFGTKDALLADAFAHAVERDLTSLDAAVARGEDAVDRLRRVIRLYGPTGAAPGWQLWIDAWALAQREPVIRKVLRRMDQRWRSTLLGVIETGVEEGAFTCPDPNAAVARLSALIDGLSVANLVYRSVSRAQLRRWVAEAVAGELGLDVTVLVPAGHVTPASGRRSRGR